MAPPDEIPLPEPAAPQPEPVAEIAPPAEVPQPEPEAPQPEPVAQIAPPAEVPQPEPPKAPSLFLRDRLFELRVQAQRPTQQHLWEKSLGEYLLASSATWAVKQPRELEEEGRDEVCAIYLETAKNFRDAGWLEQASTILVTALLYHPTHDVAHKELEEVILEWVEFLEIEDLHQQAILLLEGQWERRPSDRVRSRARAVFGSWAQFLRKDGDHYGAEALEAYAAARMQHWEKLKASWADRTAKPDPPDWP
jgi:hypothetical protein